MAMEPWRLLILLLVPIAAIGMGYLLGRRRSQDGSCHDDKLPLPPPGGMRSWCRAALGVETLSFLAANSSGRGFYDFVRSRGARHGACFRTTLFGRTHVFLLSPLSRAAGPTLLLDTHPHLPKRYVRTVADLLGDHSLLCASHDAHRRMRRAVAALFASASSAAFVQSFDRLVTHYLQQLLLLRPGKEDERRVVVVLDAALDVTFRAICEMLIGKQDEGKLARLQSDVMDVTRAMLAVPLRLPGTRFYKGLQARKRIMDALRQEIYMRRQNDGLELDHRNDFLQTLLMKSHISHSAEEALTDQQILDNILTLIIAGQVTTATAITWMVKYLADNTELQDTLGSVQVDIASKHNLDSPPTLQDLNTMHTRQSKSPSGGLL